jgi:hypothetical protein
MPVPAQNRDLTWGTIHASAYIHARGLLRPAAAELRSSGVLRYRCPITGSFILVTDEATLGRCTCPRIRLRCADCGEQHLVTLEAVEPAIVVAQRDKP